MYLENRSHSRHTKFAVIAALLLLGISVKGNAAMTVSPSATNTGNYTISWSSAALGCFLHDVFPPYGVYIEICAFLVESVNDGPLKTVATTGSSKSFTGKTAGTYRYEVWTTWTGWQYGSPGQQLVDGPLVVTVVPPAVPGTPSGPTGVEYDGAYTISWNAVTDATSYTLRERLNSGSWSEIYSGSATSRSLSGKSAGTWSYRVRACGTSGCSAYSGTKTVTVALPDAPGTPSGPTTTIFDGAFTISWSAVTGATSYRLEESFNSGSWTEIYNGSSTSRSLTGKSAGNWSYRLRACSAVGCSGYSGTRTVAVSVPVAPGTPSGPSVTQHGQSLTISWNTVSGATSYRLEERFNSGSWSEIYNGSSSSQTFSGKASGTWSYRVRACAGSACSSYSGTRDVIVAPVGPGAPSGPASDYDGAYTISWNASTGATSYRLQERLSGGSWSTIHNGPGTSKSISGKTTGDWQYRVRACIGSGCSGYSGTTTVSVLLPPAAPATPSGPAQSDGSYQITWTSVPTATSYRLEQRLDSGSWTQVYSGSALSRTFGGQAPGLWRYRVRACNAAGCGSRSSTRTVRVAPLFTTDPPPAGEGVGITAGTFSVDLLGNATYRIPIAVVPGTAGLQPDLALVYSSGGGDGYAGLGFAITGVSSITRCHAPEANGVGSVEYNATDRFCLDGKRLIAIQGTYGADGTEYRTEIDTFARIASYGTAGSGPAYFKVWTKAGHVLEYGATADSRIEAQGRSEVRVWALNKVTDAAGNFMRVTYWEDPGKTDFQPELIEYTMNTAAGVTTPFARVDFVYEPRPDVKPGDLYQGGSAITNSTNRLTNIRTYEGQTLVKDYVLEYDNNGLAGNGVAGGSRVTSVTECSATTCLRPLVFEWAGNGSAPVLGANALTLPNMTDYTPVFGDWNGDGRTDLFLQKNKKVNGDGVSRLYLAGPDGTPQLTSFAPADWAREDGANRNRVITGDFNADGLTDIAVIKLIYRRTQTYYDPSTNVYVDVDFYDAKLYVYHASLAGGFSMVLKQNGLTLAEDIAYDTSQFATGDISTGDFNGDGRTDLRRRVASANAYSEIYYAKSNGTFDGGTPDPSSSSVTGDFNGDGRTDLLGSKRINDTLHWGVWFSTGTSFEFAGSGSPPPAGIRAADVNGDGLDDLVSEAYSLSRVYLSRGDGSFEQVWSMPDGDASSIAIGDWNNDGRADISYVAQAPSSQRKFAVSTGDRSTGTSYFKVLPSTPSSWSAQPLFSADFNGDGLTDVWIQSSNGPSAYTSAYTSGGGRDLIVRITDGLGAEIDIEYAPLTDANVYTGGSAPSYPAVTIQNATHVVKAVEVDDGVGGKRRTRYAYETGSVDISRLLTLGFKKITVTDERAQMRETTTYKQQFPFIGMPERTTRHYIGSGEVLLEDTTYTLAGGTATNGVYVPFVQKEVTKRYELNGTFVSRSETTYAYDSYGNPTSTTTQLFDVASGGTAKYATTVASQFRNETTSGKWLLGMLICERTTASAPNVPAQTRTRGFEYNANGFMTKEAIEPMSGTIAEPAGVSNCVTTNASDSTLTLVTTFAYDAFGNITTITADDLDSANPPRSTTIAYGELNASNQISASNGRFAVRRTNAKGHVEYFQYDGRFGVVVRHRSINGQNTIFEHDDYGRPTLEQRPDGSQTEIRPAWCTTASCPTGGAMKVVTLADGQPPSSVITDFLGREIQSAERAFRGETIVVATEYDNLGRVQKKSLPYVPGETPKWVTFQYDALGRVKREQRPKVGGSIVTTFSYSPLSIVTTNDKGHATTERYTLRGELQETIDAAGTSTTYKYDAFGNLLETQTSGLAATRIVNTYDLRGRKRTMDDPDLSPGSGLWTYGYNGFGEIERQIDAKSQVLELDYDVLGRVVRRVEPEGTTTFEFDTAANGLGLIASSVSAEGETKAYSYDAFSRLVGVMTTISGSGTFTTSRTYDVDGRLETLTYPSSTAYPSGFRLRYVYNPYGYLAEVWNDSASNALYWRRDSATLGATTETFGNGVSTTTTFVRETGRVASIQSTGPSGPANNVQNLAYEFDSLGNLTLREDEKRGVLERSGLYGSSQQNDSYDALNRLRRVERVLGGVSQGVKTYQYDALGNLTQKSDLGTYSYGTIAAGCSSPAGPHAVTEVEVNPGVKRSMCYDANGNQTLGYNFTQNRPRTITWTSYNKPKTITEAEQTVTFSYGADRSRFKQTNAFAGETTIYVDGVYERRTIGTLHEHVHYIVADGMAVAIYRSASDGIQSTRYLHRDHLDSVVEVTNESGSVVESFSFDAWGARRNPVNWSDAATQIYGNETPRGYTGHEHLDDIGLVHMNGRVQDPKLGRMLSADPFVQFPDYSQSFNRYSYVLNNPLTHTDPTGYCLSAGPSCATGGFVPGLGGAIGGTRSATISKSYGYHYSFVAIQFQLSFPGIWSYGGVPNVAACYLPGCVASYYLDGHYPPGFGAPTLTIAVYVVQGGYYRAVAPSYGPVNDHVGSGWFAKLWGRWTAPVQEPQGGVPIGAIASMGGAAAVEAGAGGAGFWSSVYSGSTAVARTVVSVPFAVLMSIPANGFWGNSAERCFDAPATAGCPGAAVWNESSKGDGSPNNALNADQTSPGDPNQFDPDETENRLHHIFNSRSHDTKELLALSRELGGNRAAYQAIRSAALQEIRAQGLGEGVYRVGVNVAGRSFTVQGIIRDGVVRIGSMW